MAPRLTLIKTWFWNIYAVVRLVVTHAERNINLEIKPQASGSLTRLPLNEKKRLEAKIRPSDVIIKNNPQSTQFVLLFSNNLPEDRAYILYSCLTALKKQLDSGFKACRKRNNLLSRCLQTQVMIWLYASVKQGK